MPPTSCLVRSCGSDDGAHHRPAAERPPRAHGAAGAPLAELAGIAAPADPIDRLMGHARPSVRGRHYSAPDYSALLRAVESIRLDLGGESGHDAGSKGDTMNRPRNRPKPDGAKEGNKGKASGNQ